MHPYRFSYADGDIVEGLAPFLRAEDLRESSDFLGRFGLAHSSADSCANHLFAAGDRYFVVVGRDAGLVALTPVFSIGKAYRRAVTGKVGHSGWVDHPTNFDPSQVWVTSAHAVVRAAELAGDLSTPARRNLVLPEGIREMRSAIRGAFTPPPALRDAA